MNTRTLTKISLCISLLCISAYISFPLPFTPTMVTSQTIIINLLALILLPKEAFIAVLVYIVLGICGLPVFSGGTSGFGRILGPTGGFIIGFLITAPIISLLKGNSNKIKNYLLLTILVGMPIIYICGTISMCLVLHIGIISALYLSVFPFIFGDILKCIIGSFLALKLNRVLLY